MLPDELNGVGASPALDPVFFWVCGDLRRIVVADYADLKVLGERVFKRFIGGRGRWSDFQTTLHKLHDPGRPAAAVIDQHVIGYVRPWTLAGQEVTADSKPTMIACSSKRGFYLISPVLEHELTQTFGPAGRARQAFTRPDVRLAS